MNLEIFSCVLKSVLKSEFTSRRATFAFRDMFPKLFEKYFIQKFFIVRIHLFNHINKYFSDF